MEKTLSIIVPCNNIVGKFHIIEGLKTIDSDEVEIIFMEDSSTDETVELIHEEAKGLKVDWQIESGLFGGPGPARNRGLELCSGKYVWMIDADDKVMPGSVIRELGRFRECDYDYYTFGIIRFEKSRYNEANSNKVRLMPSYDDKTLFDRMAPLWTWNVISRRAFLLEYDIKSLSQVYVQVDFYNILQVVQHAKSYYIIDDYCYEYLFHISSLSHETIRPRSLSKWITCIGILKFVEQHVPEELERFDRLAQGNGLSYDWDRYLDSGQYADMVEAMPYVVSVLKRHGLAHHIRTFLQRGSLKNRAVKRMVYAYANAIATIKRYDMADLKAYYLAKEARNEQRKQVAA